MTPEARHRERIRTPVLAVTALAWLALALGLADVGAHTAHAEVRTMAIAPQADGMSGHQSHPAPEAAAEPAGDRQVLAREPGNSPPRIVSWSLLLTAMLGPLLIPALRHVMARSLPRRRWRAATLLVTAYAGTWSVGLLALSASATALGRLTLANGPGALAAGVVGAVVWQLSPAKQRCLNRCHLTPPIAAFGRAADLDAARFGGVFAFWCFGSCWALMLLPLLVATNHLTLMALVSAWMWLERLDTPTAATWRLRVPARSGRVAIAATRSGLGAAWR